MLQRKHQSPQTPAGFISRMSSVNLQVVSNKPHAAVIDLSFINDASIESFKLIFNQSAAEQGPAIIQISFSSIFVTERR